MKWLKDKVGLLSSSFLLIALVLLQLPASAAAPDLTVHAQVDHEQHTVTITGTISSGALQEVTVLVTDADGRLDYINQTTSDYDGRYEFRYKPDELKSGTYTVKVGGAEVTQLATETFTYGDHEQEEEQEQEQTRSPRGKARDEEDERSQTSVRLPGVVVSEHDLRTAERQGDAIIVEVADEEEALIVPYRAAKQLVNNRLRIETSHLSITIPSEVVTELLELASDINHEDLQMVLRFERLTREEVEAALLRGNNAMMSMAGTAVRLELAVESKNGRMSRQLSAFSTPIEISLKVDQDADERLIGVYYFNERTDEWEYIGGNIDAETRHISASLPHFSVFAVMEYNKSFADVPVHHWAHQTIRTLAAKHIVQGVTESEFAPQQDVTRAEFTTLLVRMLGLQQSNAAHAFTDIPSAAWYADDVAAAYEAGVVRGSSGNRFIPNGVISRQEMAAMLVRAYDYAGGQQTNGQATSYTDQEKIAHWAVQDVTRATEIGLLMGHNGMFRPEATTTRAEAAQAIYNLLTLLED